MKSTEAAKEVTAEQNSQLMTAMEYIPADKYDWSPGGCAKTARAIFAECAATYRWIAKLLRDENTDWHALIEDSKNFADLAAAKQMLEDSQQEFFAELEKLDEARLCETIDPGWGMTMQVNQFIFLPSYHTGYHAGQLNYLQAILGDAEMHF